MATSSDLRIVDYVPAHHDRFRALNTEWITTYFALEEPDRRALDEPERHILAAGGAILMAESGGQVVGTVALLRMAPRVFELAKMAVAPPAQGRGIGHALGRAAIERARALGAARVELLSNTLLAPAIGLYRKLGFVEVPMPPTEYARANIKMVLELGDTGC
jgi:GNAT superfamily N-acetyltransferase